MLNDLLIRAARGQEVERPPVWLMRQAGRILPEYRAVRNALKDFKELVQTPEKAAEVTIQPVDILNVDAAIIFSDILVIPEALGLDYEMIKGKGPHFPEVISTDAQVEKLRGASAASELQYVYDAIRITKKELNGRVPLIGFAGAPLTIFCYMIEGSGSKTFSEAKKALYQRPEFSARLLQKITDISIAYLKNQIESGADLIQIFDSWAGILGEEEYKAFSLPYIQQICDAIDEVPITVFAKGAHGSVADMAKLNCETIGLDWTQNPEDVRKLAPNKTLQGNLDPCKLYIEDERLVSETLKMLSKFGTQRYIANLGHGVYPDTDPEKVKLFVNTIKEFKNENS